jgi:hypothetical protein
MHQIVESKNKIVFFTNDNFSVLRSEYAGELSFSAGEIIYLVRRVNADWLEGETTTAMSGGRGRGLLPASFIEVVVPLDEEEDDDDVEEEEEDDGGEPQQQHPASTIDTIIGYCCFFLHLIFILNIFQ